MTNIKKINENIDIKVRKSFEYTDDDKILTINGHVIGNGYYFNSGYDIQNCFMNLLKNETILQKLVNITNTNLVLSKDIDIIVKDVDDISRSIKEDYYDKKSKLLSNNP